MLTKVQIFERSLRMADYLRPERDRVALLTINAQRDFTAKGSPLRACGVERAVPKMGRLATAFRAFGAPIFHAVRLYRPDGSNVDSFRRQAVEEGLRVLMPGTSGVELIEQVKPAADIRLVPRLLFDGEFQAFEPREWSFYKPRWGAFHDTGLEGRLRQAGATTLVICGCNFSTSGRATVYEAGARDFRVILVPDALTGADESAIREMGRIGIYLMNTDDCIGWLNGPKRGSAAA